jgi:ribosomal protein L37E
LLPERREVGVRRGSTPACGYGRAGRTRRGRGLSRDRRSRRVQASAVMRHSPAIME